MTASRHDGEYGACAVPDSPIAFHKPDRSSGLPSDPARLPAGRGHKGNPTPCPSPPQAHRVRTETAGVVIENGGKRWSVYHSRMLRKGWSRNNGHSCPLNFWKPGLAFRAMFCRRLLHFVSAIVMAFLVFFLEMGCVASPPPDAEGILREARLTPTLRPAILEARIRDEESTTPVTMELKEGVIRYRFPGQDRELQLKLGDVKTTLSERVGGLHHAVSGAQLHDPVGGTGLSYQDLSLGFLYWPSPEFRGEEIVKTRPCWKLDLQSPPGEEIYGVARVWIDKESGALLRIEGYDKQGRLLRRFEIVSAQKTHGIWMLRQMRIEGFEPGKSVAVSRHYLEVSGLKPLP